MFFCSCTKNDTSTIILMGEENNVADFDTLCPEILQRAMLQHGYGSGDMSFHLVTPHNIEGKYVVDGMYILHTNEVFRAGTDYEVQMIDHVNELNALHSDSLVFELAEQNNSSIKMHYQLFSGADLTYDLQFDNAFVAGAVIDNRGVNDTVFILYYECVKGYPVKDSGWDCEYKSRELITGVVTEGGIKDFRFGCICHDKWGEDDYLLQRVDDYRISMDYNTQVSPDYVTPRIN